MLAVLLSSCRTELPAPPAPPPPPIEHVKPIEKPAAPAPSVPEKEIAPSPPVVIVAPEPVPPEPESPAPEPPPPWPITRIIPPEYGTSPFIAPEVFITDWAVLKRFDPEAGNRNDRPAIHRQLLPDESRLDSNQGDDWRAWRSAENGGKSGKINLGANNDRHAAAYAFAAVESPVALDNLRLCVGSSGHVKVWLNGRLVHTYAGAERLADWDQDVVGNKINLREGVNHILLKTTPAPTGWEFFLRLTDRNGLPLSAK